jgi:argininosuccinate synthase
MEYARSKNIPVLVTKDKPYSSDGNLLHISFEGGILEDTWKEPPEDIFVMTTSPEKAQDKPTYTEVEYKNGDPTSIDGENLSPAKLLARLNELGGRNGIGRVDMVENRFVGMKSRGVYETPGGTILRIAHIAMESITLDREVAHLKEELVPRYAEMIYYGYWYAPERQMLQALIDETQKRVNGLVRLKLYKGNCTVVGRKSDFSLYDPDFATFESDEVYNQQDAEGFIHLTGLRLKIARLLERKQTGGR